MDRHTQTVIILISASIFFTFSILTGYMLRSKKVKVRVAGGTLLILNAVNVITLAVLSFFF